MKIKDMNEKQLAQYKEYCRNQRESGWHKRYHMEHREHRLQYNREHREKRKKIVLDYYSNGKFECACCHENQYEFLTIDHIVKREKEHGSGAPFYNWLIRNNFPAGFQVLCFNCNCSKKYLVECPHKSMKKIYPELKKELK
jgi:hypothetical protein